MTAMPVPTRQQRQPHASPQRWKALVRLRRCDAPGYRFDCADRLRVGS
jgi:hypothetical protein